jgi:iron-sulfur cluster assembly protein
MLRLSQHAVSAIRELTLHSDLSDHAGLRIASAAVGNGAADLVASIAAGPEPFDETVEAEGARVYMDPHVIPLLDDKLLDAEETGQGQVRFELVPQIGPEP